MTQKDPAMGGEIELSPDALCGSDGRSRPPGGPASVRVCSGRTALRIIARALKRRGRDRVLLPSYLCPSVLQPFDEEGVTAGFYRVRQDLTLDAQDLERQVEARSPGSLLFINYFGFPPRAEDQELLRRLKERCLLIEDCSHGSLVERPRAPVGQLGDFVLTSFRKYLPLPDGGLVINRSRVRIARMPSNEASWVYRRLLAKVLRFVHLRRSPPPDEVERTYLELFSQAERALDRDSPLLGMSAVSERLYQSLDLKQVIRRRRANFGLLLDAFRGDGRFRRIGEPLRERLPPGVSPLVFPIRIRGRRRDAIRRELALRQVYCPVHWPLPRQIRPDRFGDAHALSGTILGLPIDQRYGAPEMNSLLARVAEAWRTLE
jgi:dTDP-4-amino-4,6-dideoxygalactose transaminase